MTTSVVQAGPEPPGTAAGEILFQRCLVGAGQDDLLEAHPAENARVLGILDRELLSSLARGVPGREVRRGCAVRPPLTGVVGTRLPDLDVSERVDSSSYYTMNVLQRIFRMP
jgi:hypothetical protein